MSNKPSFPVNLQTATSNNNFLPNTKNVAPTKSLLRKRRRSEDPLDEVVVENAPKKARHTLEDAFESLSILGSKVYNFKITKKNLKQKNRKKIIQITRNCSLFRSIRRCMFHLGLFLNWKLKKF